MHLSGAVCSLVAALGAAPASADGGRFGKPIQVHAGGRPIERDEGVVSPFVGDLDGDGRPDLLLGVLGPRGRLLVYRNLGTKTAPRLGPPTWFDEAVPTGWVPAGCKEVSFLPQLADFDGDGRADLLTGSNCCDTDGFHLFRRAADGSWAPRKRLEMADTPEHPAPFGAMQRSFVTAADWDGDGVPDLLASGGRGRDIVVARGPVREDAPIPLTHDLAFTPRPDPKSGDYSHGVRDFAVADWDGDGRPDLLTRMGLPGDRGGIYWYRSLGPGLTRLAEGKRLVGEMAIEGEKPAGAKFYNARAFCVGDLTGDGRPDLIVSRCETRYSRDGPRPERTSTGTVWLFPRE